MSQIPKPSYIRDIGSSVHGNSVFGDETADSMNLTDWANLPMVTGWSSYGSGWALGNSGIQYSKDRSGIVRFRGLATLTQASAPSYSTIGSLPKGFWPEMNELGIVSWSLGSWEWGIDTAGTLQFRAIKAGVYSSGQWYSFSGISWWAPPA